MEKIIVYALVSACLEILSIVLNNCALKYFFSLFHKNNHILSRKKYYLPTIALSHLVSLLFFLEAVLLQAAVLYQCGFADGECKQNSNSFHK